MQERLHVGKHLIEQRRKSRAEERETMHARERVRKGVRVLGRQDRRKHKSRDTHARTGKPVRE